MNQLKRLFKEEEGQAMTEYGLLVGLIAIALITVLATLGTDLAALFTKVSTKLKAI
jgi:pilus assembly protein Flp/PilA